MTTFIEGGVTAAKGFQAAGVHCGIRKNRAKKDLGLICLLYTSGFTARRPIAPCCRMAREANAAVGARSAPKII